VSRSRNELFADLAVSDATLTTLHAAIRTATSAGHIAQANAYLDTVDQVHQERLALLDQLAAIDIDAAFDATTLQILDIQQEIVATIRASDPLGSRDLTDAQLLAVAQSRTASDSHTDRASAPGHDTQAREASTTADRSWDDGDEYGDSSGS